MAPVMERARPQSTGPGAESCGPARPARYGAPAAMREIVITEHEAGQRLDRLLRKLLRDVPLGAIFRHLRTGAIRVDGAKAEGDLRLVAGMRVTLKLPPEDIVDALAAADVPV